MSKPNRTYAQPVTAPSSEPPLPLSAEMLALADALARLARASDDTPTEAMKLLLEELALRRELGDPLALARCLSQVARAHECAGDKPSSKQALLEELEILRTLQRGALK